MGDRVDTSGLQIILVSFERLPEPLPGIHAQVTEVEIDLIGIAVLEVENDTAGTLVFDPNSAILTANQGQWIALPLTGTVVDQYLRYQEFMTTAYRIAPDESERIALLFSLQAVPGKLALRIDGVQAVEVLIDECHCSLPLPWTGD